MKSSDNIKYKSLRIWVILICIVTLIYSIYWYCNYENHPVAYYDTNRLTFLRNNTPSHPPPLTSFMDPPDVFNDKYGVESKSFFSL